MGYGNLFPVTYQPFYSSQQAQQITTNNIIWVSGEAGAKAYLVAPNSTVQLWDSERQTIYLKSADASGMPSIKVLDYTIRENGPTSPANGPATQVGNCAAYATKSEIEALQAQIKAIQDKLKEAEHE